MLYIFTTIEIFKKPKHLRKASETKVKQTNKTMFGGGNEKKKEFMLRPQIIEVCLTFSLRT